MIVTFQTTNEDDEEGGFAASLIKHQRVGSGDRFGGVNGATMGAGVPVVTTSCFTENILSEDGDHALLQSIVSNAIIATTK